MALTPETSAALKDALEAVIQECGDTPGYEDLVGKLKDAEAAIPAEHGHAPEHGDHDGADAESPAEDAGEPSADDMFAEAEAKHKAARKPKGGDHENPFAKGDK